MQPVQFKIIFRNWRKNKIYTAISLLSLIMGLTCGILLITFVLHEFRIAHAIPDQEHCYIVREQTSYQSIPGNTLSSAEIAPFLQTNYPEVKSYCTFHYESISLLIDNQKIACDQMYSVSSNLQNFFHFPLLAGDLQTTLQSSTEIAVTQSFARKYLGCDNPIGQSLSLERAVPYYDGQKYIYRETEEVYTITSVIDDSQKTLLRFQLLRNIPEECNQGFNGFAYYVFVQLAPTTDIPSLLQNVNKTKHANMQGEIQFTPTHQLYFSEQPHLFDTELIAKRDIIFVHISLSVAFLLLLVACFNHININLTQALKQLRDTGIQFISGKSKADIRLQLIVETGILVLFSFGISLALLYRLIPRFSTFVNSDLQFSDLYTGYTPLVILFLLALLTTAPALYVLLKINVTSLSAILKQEYRHRNHLTRNIVIAQFCLSIILFTVVLNIRQQMQYITHYRPHSEEIITLWGSLYQLDDEKRNHFRDQLTSIPEIQALTSTAVHQNMSFIDDGIVINYMDADDAFWDFYDIRLLEGRHFSPGKQAYREAIVNETFVQKKEWHNPLGKQLSLVGEDYTIVGIVQDFPTDKFTKHVDPLLIRYSPNGADRTVIRVQQGSLPLVREKITALWHQLTPEYPTPILNTMVDTYLKFHEEEQRTLQSVSAFTLISLLLTGMGLFGLAWFSVESRTKEICLRKINGASEKQIVILLCARFIKWILIACCIAIPISLYLSHQWLTQFVYKTDLNAYTLLFAGITVILIGLFTVIWQTIKAARMNPVESIKSQN